MGQGTDFFQQQKNKYQPIVEAAEQAQGKLAAANLGLSILAKENITQTDAESLVELVQQAS